MAFDFNKIKQRLTIKNIFARKQTETNAVTASTQEVDSAKKSVAKPATGWLADAKKGMNDIKRVVEEGNYKLFAKQLVVLLLVFLGVRFLNQKLTAQRDSYVDRVSAISIQQTNEQDYLDNKARLLRLEPAFPDISNKNEWLLRKIMDMLESHQIQATISGNVSENTTDNYTVMSQPVSFQQNFFDLGKFMADIENSDDFLRISEISIAKATDSASLGLNTVNIRFNTLFPKEKYGPRLFKDYAKQMQALNAEKAKKEDKPEQTEKTETQTVAATTAAQSPATEEKTNEK